MLGDIEPSDEMCEWPSDTEDEDDDDLADEAEEKLKIEAPEGEGMTFIFVPPLLYPHKQQTSATALIPIQYLTPRLMLYGSNRIS